MVVQFLVQPEGIKHTGVSRNQEAKLHQKSAGTLASNWTASKGKARKGESLKKSLCSPPLRCGSSSVKECLPN
eukprot:1367365-Amphidinium_carterae.1